MDKATASEQAVLRVAIDMPRATLFDYLPPAGLRAAQVPLGARVRAPIGTRERVGVVVEHADRPTVGADRLKAIRALIDDAALFDAAAAAAAALDRAVLPPPAR